MKNRYLFLALLILTPFLMAYSQHENVSLENPVYDYLKAMSVKKVIGSIHDDIPSMSKKEVTDYLKKIKTKEKELSTAEKDLLFKYWVEFADDDLARKNSYSFFGGDALPESRYIDFLCDKQKYLYVFKRNDNNLTIDGLGHLWETVGFKPRSSTNATLFDVGFRARGSLFDHLGYYFSLEKGGATGNPDLLFAADPRLKFNYKFIENIENLRNYDFHNAYMRYYTEPTDGMNLSFQIGREPIKVGVSYSNSLTISGNNPTMDFVKFGFNYGVVSFTSMHASTVGTFDWDMTKRYTKYYASNRLRLSFPDVLDFGIMESEIYSGRGMELAYLTPISFYKFIEFSLQDRDNGAMTLDLQTHFLKNLQFQMTFFVDENPLGNLQDLNLAYANKTAYQIGAYVYEPFNISNLSFILDYTRIRPYTYTHLNPMNTFTAYGTILGDATGPNSDKIFAKLAYTFSRKLSMSVEYNHIRKGDNVLDSLGNIIKNVGGNVFQPWRKDIDSDQAYFLDGVRTNKDIFKFDLKIEPIRNFIFDIIYYYEIQNHLTLNTKSNISYGLLRMSIDY